MKKRFLLTITLCCISALGFSQKDTTKSNSSSFYFKLGGGAYFLQNKLIRDIHRTSSFPTVGVGIEAGSKRVNVSLDVFSTLETKINLDSTRYSQPQSSFTQTYFAVGLLQKTPLTPQVSLRGRAGFTFAVTREKLLGLRDGRVGAQLGVGLEFLTVTSLGYFIDFNYQLQSMESFGNIGGFHLALGVLLGGQSSK